MWAIEYVGLPSLQTWGKNDTSIAKAAKKKIKPVVPASLQQFGVMEGALVSLSYQ